MNTFYQTPAVRIRLSWVIGVFAFISFGMLCRSTYIQIWGDTKLENLARRQFQSKILMKPRRGLITDRTGEPLAINLETSSLAGNPQKIIKSRSTLHLLSHALNIPMPVLKKRLDSKKAFTWFERHITDERMERFKKLGLVQTNGDMPEGLWIIKEMKRIYPHGELATSLIGSVNVDTEGLEGVELWKNSLMRGNSASFDAFKDALGRPALYNSTAQSKMKDGENVELSIDASLQYSVEESLEAAMVKTRAASGIVLVMDSQTGEILALAQSDARGLPGKKVKKVFALTDGYEPGSTLKPLILASAINKGVVKANDTFFGYNGKFKIQGRTISEAEAHEKFQYITLKKMIEVSSNVVAAQLAIKLGAERTVESLHEMGFGAKTGTAFPGEISGWVPATAKGIRPLTLATMGFGQSLVVTPLQMLRGYAALSNGGFLIEPTLLKRSETDRAAMKRVPLFKPQTVQDVTSALLMVTGDKGTGKKAQVDGYRVAGKTGTAQTVDPKTKKYSTSRYIASFAGFPVGVKQPIVILALLDHPKGVYYAGDTAAPLFSQVLKQTVSRFSIQATEQIDIPLVQSTPEPTHSVSESQVIKVAQSSAEIAAQSVASAKEVNIDHPVMPSLVGLTPQEAMRSLKPFAPQVHLHGFGLIRKQTPESGSTIAPNVRVSLFLEE